VDQLVGQVTRQADIADLVGDALGVVGYALDRHAQVAVALLEQREAAARVAVLRLPDRAAVDEEHAAVLADPGLVRVPEEEDVAVGELGDPLEGARRSVVEQVLVTFRGEP
jgi:hypothetical protein